MPGLPDGGFDDLGEVRPPDLRRFLAAEAERRPAPSSQARTVAALKCSFASASRTSTWSTTPRTCCARRRSARCCPTCSTGASCAAACGADREGVWERHSRQAGRDRLLLALFAYAGLRRAELLGLDWDDVDLERRLIRVRKAKGGRQRVVPIHPGLVPLFEDYLRVRPPRQGACAVSRRSGPAAFPDDLR